MTEQMEQTEQLNLKALIDNLPGMVVRYRDLPGWPMEFVSAGSLALTGYAPEELCGRGSINFPQIIHTQDGAGIEESKQQAIQRGDSLEAQYRIISKNGEVRWIVERSKVLVTAAGEPALIEGFLTDVTTRKQQEEQLQRLQSALEHISETIVITDSNGVIEYVNPAFEQLTGYCREEAIGKSLGILKSDQHNQKFYDTMWESLRRGETWKGHLINKSKHGECFEEEATITPIFDASGTLSRLVGLNRNVTREAALKSQLQQAQRTEAIGTLAGGIAHDFNNILASILGYAEIARDQTPASNAARTSIERVIQAGDRAARLVKQILTFSQESNEELLPVHLQQTVPEVLSLLRSSLPAIITLEQRIAADCPPVQADITQINQVIMNLFVNARQAIGNNPGRISVTLAEKAITAPLVAASGILLKPGKYVVIAVSDDGCGMAAEVQSQIFDPFFTTKTLSEGAGLGLSVVHGIVKKHGGALTLTSTPGQGTLFCLYLPACAPILPTRFNGNDAPDLRGEETILLVDDEQQLVQMLQNGLERLGYHVLSYTNSTDALEYFTRHRETIDLVVTDMTMPVMAGDVLSRELLQLKPDLPIILCTGFSEVIDETRALSIGIRKFIMKPVAPRNLAQAIRTLLQNGEHPHS